MDCSWFYTNKYMFKHLKHLTLSRTSVPASEIVCTILVISIFKTFQIEKPRVMWHEWYLAVKWDNSVFFYAESIRWQVKLSEDKSTVVTVAAVLRPLHGQCFAQERVCVWGRYENTLFKQCISVCPAYFSRLHYIVLEHVYFSQGFNIFF